MKRSMHIGLIIGIVHKIGGMERQAILLAKELKHRGYKVTLFVSGLKKGISSAVDISGLDCIYLYHTSYTGFISRRLLWHYCRQKNITHLVAYHFSNARIAVKAGTDCRVIYNVRSIRFSSQKELVEEYMKVARRAERLITNSGNTAALLQKCGIAGKDKISVIRNGISLPAAEPCLESGHVLYVGSIKKVKGPITFVKACHAVIKRDSGVKVVICGDGIMRADIEKYIRDNGLGENFRLLGEIPSEKIPYRDASVFVNSSIRESNSNSLLEALSFGIPVVATDNPGNRDILTELEGHRMVRVADSESMAQSIYELLRLESRERKIIFDKSREYIRKNNSISTVVDNYIKELEEL